MCIYIYIYLVNLQRHHTTTPQKVTEEGTSRLVKHYDYYYYGVLKEMMVSPNPLKMLQTNFFYLRATHFETSKYECVCANK